MFVSSLSLSLAAIGAILPATGLPANGLPASSYAVKERHIVPRGWSEIGKPSGSDIITLSIGLKQSNEGEVERHLMEVSDPTHHRYGDHLTAEEINDIVSPSDETVDLAHAWLTEHGITDIAKNPARDWVTIQISIEKAEELLQTTYSTYQHTDGTTLSRAKEWSLPLHLHEHVDVVQPTTSFWRPKRKASTLAPIRDEVSYPMSWWEHTGKDLHGGFHTESLGSDADAIAKVCNITFTTPTCLRTLYGTIDYKPQAAKKNKLGITNYLNETSNRPDIQKALQAFRPEAVAAADEFKIVKIDNPIDVQTPTLTPEQLDAGLNIEGVLDAELSLSIAWPTQLVSWLTGGSPPFIPDLSTPTNTNEPYLAWLNFVLAERDLPQVISTSYGEAEQTIPESYARRACAGFAQLGARGISVLFSSGDSGVGSDGTCFSNTDPEKAEFLPAFPASCPWVTAVGATEGFSPEITVQRFGSGAGFSNYFPQPAYQKKTVHNYIRSLNGTYDGLYNKKGRGYPDVAAQGNHDAIVWAGNIRTVGGSSASSPTFAAVIALVNDALLAKGRKPLGFLNPWIYGGAYKALTDVTVGSSFGCNTSGFPAQEGWDAATGFGTPNFKKLLAAAFATDKYGRSVLPSDE